MYQENNGIHNNGTETINSIYSSEEVKLVPFMDNNKWGYIDIEGNIVITPRFESAGYFEEGFAPVWVSDEECGYIDDQGNFVVSPEFSYAGKFHQGVAIVYKGERQLLINSNGEVLKEETPQYELDGIQCEGMYRIEQDNKFGYIDHTGDIIIAPQYSEAAGIFTNGLAWVSDVGENSSYFINNQGHKVIEKPNYMLGESFSQGLSLIRDPNTLKNGYMNMQGEIMIPLIISGGFFFSEGRTQFLSSDGKRGYINRQGEVAIQPTYDDVTPFIRGRALVTIKKKYHFIDYDGNIVMNSLKRDSMNFESYVKNCALIKIYNDSDTVYMNRHTGDIVHRIYNQLA